ncbi:MAG: hypothetical protein WDA18_02655 [Candidatus Ratteibacteria bacterium]|jgi:hypothetical protein
MQKGSRFDVACYKKFHTILGEIRPLKEENPPIDKEVLQIPKTGPLPKKEPYPCITSYSTRLFD